MEQKAGLDSGQSKIAAGWTLKTDAISRTAFLPKQDGGPIHPDEHAK
jgi:hypothetical protein